MDDESKDKRTLPRMLVRIGIDMLWLSVALLVFQWLGNLQSPESTRKLIQGLFGSGLIMIGLGMLATVVKVVVSDKEY